VINGLVLPVVLVFTLALINDASVMGKHTNGVVLNVVSWISVAVLIVLSAATVVFAIRDNFFV